MRDTTGSRKPNSECSTGQMMEFLLSSQKHEDRGGRERLLWHKENLRDYVCIPNSTRLVGRRHLEKLRQHWYDLGIIYLISPVCALSSFFPSRSFPTPLHSALCPGRVGCWPMWTEAGDSFVLGLPVRLVNGFQLGWPVVSSWVGQWGTPARNQRVRGRYG